SKQGTWFDPGLGACGYVDSPSDLIIAIASSQFGAGGNCNRVTEITGCSYGIWVCHGPPLGSAVVYPPQ
ncbi:hypothetical protein BDM02DRAFT_3090746, partial [Thelephora ganbajun]